MSTKQTEADASGPTFDAIPLSAEVRRAVDELGYVQPTPVQLAIYEPATRGKDLVVQARTGTGKTAAFGMPIIDTIVHRTTEAVQVMVLCPTRELALQVTRELESLAKHRGVAVAAVYGGAPMARQVQLLAEGAQILVGTPGRVLDHLRRGTLDSSAIRLVVLDECDEILSMGFLPQINDILERLPTPRQTLLFSATVPKDVVRIAETRLIEPEFVTLSGDHIGALEVDHFVYVSRGDKLTELTRILEVEDPESAIVFCNTRERTKQVSAKLVACGFDADWLNADLSQADREKVMRRTREGKLRFLVATDVAARGIDISHLTHVLNFDFPESAEQYVHRTGRTGRAGRLGTAVSLVAPADIGNLYMLRLTYKIRPVEKHLPSSRELKTRLETDIVQMLVSGFGSQVYHPDDLAIARRLLTHERVEDVVAGLVREHLGKHEDAPAEAAKARRAGAVRAPKRPQSTGEESVDANPGSRKGPARRKEPDETRASAARERDNPDVEVMDVAEIFVNVGRKDGAKASDLREALHEQGGISKQETAYVRVRHRHSFVGVHREALDRAIAALDGVTIAGKPATAEPARRA